MQTLTNEEKEIVTGALLSYMRQISEMMQIPLSEREQAALQDDMRKINDIIDKIINYNNHG